MSHFGTKLPAPTPEGRIAGRGAERAEEATRNPDFLQQRSNDTAAAVARIVVFIEHAGVPFVSTFGRAGHVEHPSSSQDI